MKKDSKMSPNFEVELLPDAIEFLENLDDKAREKIYYNIRRSQWVYDNELFKKLNEHIWEFRTFYNGKAYRLFAFWDKTDVKKTIVLSTHAILKKTQKTPLKEIRKAEEIRFQYLNNKTQNKQHVNK
ncbi:type II toxin-antitoxin system RelE/ParE family toxin [Haoranjiania flava]|uniref:Type II toxin-antitoxin system RelE/ParE family toxin n=1 Tax=Haoranjiania flava TaxID=1856322 RepID=A0AAE3IL08_9BACT|nr:type II toxin-antitoxin system RelE/ParE family toxin [Haoranjiania flava]MCU7693738.1 type II toxin-antitoxin system RelE/ParE family toxin [Haoranjiania flava]